MATQRDKLAQHYELSASIVTALQEGSYNTPAQIRTASDDDLLAVLTAGQLATLKASAVYRE